MRKLTDHIVEGDSCNHQLEITVKDEPGYSGANHHYEIAGMDTRSNPSEWEGSAHLAYRILFQSGPIKEFGVNGVTHEVFLAILIDRMKSFQSGPFACDDNQDALEFCEGAMEALQRRTVARIARGVEGTHQK